jgi:hypothetical protein
VFYAVNQSGAVRPVSEVLSLQVVTLPATALSELVILEAANGGAGPEFDVSGATTATLRVGVWPLIAEGQPVWLSLSGTRDNGSPYSKVIWAAGGAKVNASWVMDGYWTNNLPMADLKQLKDGSSLTITFKAGLDGTQVEGNALAFVARTYSITAKAPLLIDDDFETGLSGWQTFYGGRHYIEGEAGSRYVLLRQTYPQNYPNGLSRNMPLELDKYYSFEIRARSARGFTVAIGGSSIALDAVPEWHVYSGTLLAKKNIRKSVEIQSRLSESIYIDSIRVWKVGA